MGFFDKLFKPKPTSEYKRFEKAFDRIWRRKTARRESDKRNAFLTRDLLRRRQEVTKGGKKLLVLQYGTKGETVEYSLDQLNKMAKAVEQSEGKFKEAERGVSVKELLTASLPKDIARAKAEISNATLYRIQGSDLHFKVTASEQSNYKHHQVRIRLEEWETQIRKTQGSLVDAARAACRGRISYTCDCGRHQYWFRYLTTIGGFALEPFEHAFPKIRNPGLKGCCCKHMIKTIGVMQMSAIHHRLAKEMDRQAQKKGWFTKLFGGKEPKETYLDGEDLQAAEKAGNREVVELEKEFGLYQKAKEAMKEKSQSSPPPKKTRPRIAPQKKEKLDQAAKFIGEMKDHIISQTAKGKSRDQAIASFAKKYETTTDKIRNIADKMGI